MLADANVLDAIGKVALMVVGAKKRVLQGGEKSGLELTREETL